MNTVTQLFLMYEKPAHKGVYKLARIDNNPQIWCYWDGLHWGWTAQTPDQAELLHGMSGPLVHGMSGPLVERPNQCAVIGWRGLADNPNA